MRQQTANLIRSELPASRWPLFLVDGGGPRPCLELAEAVVSSTIILEGMALRLRKPSSTVIQTALLQRQQ